MSASLAMLVQAGSAAKALAPEAVLYVGADLVLNGSVISAVSGFHDHPNDRWNVDGTATWTDTQG